MAIEPKCGHLSGQFRDCSPSPGMHQGKYVIASAYYKIVSFFAEQILIFVFLYS